MAGGSALRQLPFLSLARSLVLIGCHVAAATATDAPSTTLYVTPAPSQAATSGALGEASITNDTSPEVVGIACGFVALFALGIVGVCWTLRETEGKDDIGAPSPKSPPGARLGHDSSAVAPKEDISAWGAVEEGEGGGRGKSTANPLYAVLSVAQLAGRSASDSAWRTGVAATKCVSFDSGGGNASIKTAVGSASSGQPSREGYRGSSSAGAAAAATAAAATAAIDMEAQAGDPSPRYDTLHAYGPVFARKRARNKRIAPSSSFGSNGESRGRVVLPSPASFAAAAASRNRVAPSPTLDPHELLANAPTPSRLRARHFPIGDIVVASPPAAAATDNMDKFRPVATTPNPPGRKKTLRRRNSDGGSTLCRGGGIGGGGGREDSVVRLREGVGASVLMTAEDVVRVAEVLATESFLPGVREVSMVVAGLARLAAADHRGNTGDMERRVGWCRAVVLSLERARDLLSKSAERDGEAERMLLDDVLESIRGMAEIVQSYKSKQMVSMVFASTLCKRRLDEAEEAINAAEGYLQSSASKSDVSLGQTPPRHSLVSTSNALAMQDGSQGHRKSFQTILVKSARKRRRQRLGQVDIPASDVHITPDEILGVGGFGTVYLADYHGLNAAVKVVIFKKDPDEERPKSEIEEDVLAAVWMTDDEAALDQKRRRREAVARAKRAYVRVRMQNRQRLAIMRELESMKRLRSPYTVHLHGAVTSLSDRLVLVMELLPGGDLRSRLRRARRPLEESALRGIVKDVCSGMTFLHAEAFVHGDLKSTNVLFDATGRAKIADLGTSLWTQRSSRPATFTFQKGGLMSLPWAAPEVLHRRGATSKSDVYSFGMVVWECLTRELPWMSMASVSMLFYAVTEGERPGLPRDAPADLLSLIEACWAHDPSARPTLENVLADLNASQVNRLGKGVNRATGVADVLPGRAKPPMTPAGQRTASPEILRGFGTSAAAASSSSRFCGAAGGSAWLNHRGSRGGRRRFSAAEEKQEEGYRLDQRNSRDVIASIRERQRNTGDGVAYLTSCGSTSAESSPYTPRGAPRWGAM